MTQTPTETETAGLNQETQATTATTIQTPAPKDALVTDVQRVLETDRELAMLAKKQASHFDTRLKHELRDRYGWEVTNDLVRAAIDELGPRVIAQCIRIHTQE